MDELVVLPLRRALQLRQPAEGLIIHRTGDPVRSRWAVCINGVEGVSAFVAYQAQYEGVARAVGPTIGTTMPLLSRYGAA